jgi:hypothetical protein
MTLGIVPKSRGKAYWLEDINLVLNHEKYQIPTLQQAFVAMVTHYIATGKIIFPKGTTDKLETYTLVHESRGGFYLCIGNHSDSGISIIQNSLDHIGHIGIAAIQML